jgi:hypothetical protein
VLFLACGGNAATESCPAPDASAEAHAPSDCEAIGGVCVGASPSCLPGYELVSNNPSLCPLQGGCCAPTCPPARPSPNQPCSAKGLRCDYPLECISARCVGSEWNLEVRDCSKDAGTDG